MTLPVRLLKRGCLTMETCMNKVVLVVAMFLFTWAPLFSQPTYPYDALKNQYKGQSVLLLKHEQVLTCGVRKNKPDITSDYHTLVYYLDNKGISANERSITYAPGFYTIASWNVATYAKVKGKYTKIPVTQYKDEDNTGGSIFYDGIKYRKYYLPGLSEDAITETKFTYSYEDPGSLGSFYFKRNIPTLLTSYKVIVSPDIEIGYTFFGDSTDIHLTVTKEGKNTIYQWQLENGKPLKNYNDAVSDRYDEPHVFVYVKGYKSGSQSFTPLFGSVPLLYKHDYKYIGSVNKQPINGELKLVIDSIKRVAPTRFETMKGIYYWVQQHMKYIAFEDGLGGQIPREANDVFAKKYGDCKDFSSLLTVMLKEAGIQSYLCWIGTRDLPYTYEQLPLGYASNHMIAAVYENNNWIFIDGTSKHVPLGWPSAFIQGKQALIAITPDSFVVVKVPIMPDSANYSSQLVNAKLSADGKTLTGSSTVVLKGYNHSGWADGFYYAGTDKIESQMKDMVSFGNNKCAINEIAYQNLFQNDSPFTIDFTFTLPDYIRYIDGTIYINMHMRKSLADFKIDTAGGRTIARDFEYTWVDETEIRFEIPKGYKVSKLPANSIHQGADYACTFTYTIEDGSVVLRKKSNYNHLTVEKADFDKWNEVIDSITKRYKDLVLLTKQ